MVVDGWTVSDAIRERSDGFGMGTAMLLDETVSLSSETFATRRLWIRLNAWESCRRC